MFSRVTTSFGQPEGPASLVSANNFSTICPNGAESEVSVFFEDFVLSKVI